MASVLFLPLFFLPLALGGHTHALEQPSPPHPALHRPDVAGEDLRCRQGMLAAMVLELESASPGMPVALTLPWLHGWIFL